MHTPTPWKSDRTEGSLNGRCTITGVIENELPHIVATTRKVANAEFIVTACNAHEDLVALLLEIRGRGTFDPQQDSTGEKIEIALAKAGVKP